MINLLPPQAKQDIRAGRVNRLLVRYIVLFAILSLVLAAELGFAFFIMQNTKASSEANIAEVKSSTQEMAQDQLAVDEFKQNLATAKTILDKQISYSDVILRFASTIPDGIVLDNFSISPDRIGQPTTFDVMAKSDAVLLKLKDDWTESEYFTDVHLVTVTNEDSERRATISATMTSELLK